jgi:hypothetical protein
MEFHLASGGEFLQARHVAEAGEYSSALHSAPVQHLEFTSLIYGILLPAIVRLW